MKMLMTPPEGYPLVLANTLCMLYQRVKPLPPNMLVSERVSTKQLLFHNAGYSIKYSQVQRVDTTLTKRILDKLIENVIFQFHLIFLKSNVSNLQQITSISYRKLSIVKGHSMPPRWLHSTEESQQVKVDNNYLLEKEASSKYRRSYSS